MAGLRRCRGGRKGHGGVAGVHAREAKFTVLFRNIYFLLLERVAHDLIDIRNGEIGAEAAEEVIEPQQREALRALLHALAAFVLELHKELLFRGKAVGIGFQQVIVFSFRNGVHLAGKLHQRGHQNGGEDIVLRSVRGNGGTVANDVEPLPVHLLGIHQQDERGFRKMLLTELFVRNASGGNIRFAFEGSAELGFREGVHVVNFLLRHAAQRGDHNVLNGGAVGNENESGEDAGRFAAPLQRRSAGIHKAGDRFSGGNDLVKIDLVRDV